MVLYSITSSNVLRELGGGYIVVKLVPELEGVTAFCPGKRVADLVAVSYRTLRITRIRTDLKIDIVELQVGECVEPRKGLAADRIGGKFTVVAEPQFVHGVRPENVIFSERSQVIAFGTPVQKTGRLAVVLIVSPRL